MLPGDVYPQYLLTKVPEIPTLRDYLAGCFAQGAAGYYIEYVDEGMQSLVNDAYFFADKALKAREA